jgi:hypothetical protein
LGFGFFARGFAGLTAAAPGFRSLTTSGVAGAVGIVVVGRIGSAPTRPGGGLPGANDPRAMSCSH